MKAKEFITEGLSHPIICVDVQPKYSGMNDIPKKASLNTLDKIVHSKSAGPRKKQLAHWQANMRRGRAK